MSLKLFAICWQRDCIALLFDGFDELVLRVTYSRAAEHLRTLIEAAVGDAHVVVASRTQHFLSDGQVRQAFYEQVERIPNHRIVRLEPFDARRIRQFLVKRLGVQIQQGSQLVGADLRGQDLSGQDFRHADLSGADLRETWLLKSDLSHAILRQAQLDGANLSQALLSGADLRQTTLAGARLLGADLRGAGLTGSVLRRAELVGAHLDAGALEICDHSGAALPRPERLTALVASSSSCHAVSWSPDKLWLASAHTDGSIRLWERVSGLEIYRLQGHTSLIRSVAFSPDGQLLASGALDNTVRLWDVHTGTCLALLVHCAAGWVACTPAGRYKLGGDIAGSFWHVIGQCRFEPGELDPYLPEPLRLPDDALFVPWMAPVRKV